MKCRSQGQFSNEVWPSPVSFIIFSLTSPDFSVSARWFFIFHFPHPHTSWIIPESLFKSRLLFPTALPRTIVLFTWFEFKQSLLIGTGAFRKE